MNFHTHGSLLVHPTPKHDAEVQCEGIHPTDRKPKREKSPRPSPGIRAKSEALPSSRPDKTHIFLVFSRFSEWEKGFI
ncbi:hypothetical protein TNCV_3159731 [Trichonephila clavipes]|nr:hypothetical protein TNCV_3159731 [Trichonephila clavipes]